MPHTCFATKFRTNFNFIEVFTDYKPDICATNIQNTSKQVATLPTGHIGYIEVPITNENLNSSKSTILTLYDIMLLIHTILKFTESVPQTNYIIHCDDPTTPPSSIFITSNLYDKF